MINHKLNYMGSILNLLLFPVDFLQIDFLKSISIRKRSKNLLLPELPMTSFGVSRASSLVQRTIASSSSPGSRESYGSTTLSGNDGNGSLNPKKPESRGSRREPRPRPMV